MTLGESKIWQDDLARAAQAVGGIGGGRVFLVTGASGLIGSALVDLLLFLRRTRGRGPEVLAAGRDIVRLERRFGRQDGLGFLAFDANRPPAALPEADVIIHAASPASPDLYMTDPCGTIGAAVDGVRRLLDHARDQGGRVLYISSSEVYGRRTGTGPAKEDDFGAVDPLNPRLCYAEAKRAAEALCTAYSTQYGVRTSIVRPGHIYGPTASASDRRVSSDFAFRAARGEPLVLKSTGAQLRSYCHCLDAATAILAVLDRGADGAAYNISNPDSVITVRRMAELLAAAGGVPLGTAAPTAAETAAFNPMDDSSLDASRLIGLGWHGVFPAAEGLARTVLALRDVL